MIKVLQNTECLEKVCRKISSKLGCWSNETWGTDVTETERTSRRNRPAGPKKGWCPFVNSREPGPGYQAAWCHEMHGSRALLSVPDHKTGASPDQMVSYSKLCTAFCHRVMSTTSSSLNLPFIVRGCLLAFCIVKKRQNSQRFQPSAVKLCISLLTALQGSQASRNNLVKVLFRELSTALTSLLPLKVFLRAKYFLRYATMSRKVTSIFF